jgi:putative ABC transport system permease protein
METLWQDVKYGARTLLRSPGFTLVAILTLALGIGASAAIFSFAYNVLLRQLPFQEPDRLVWVWSVRTDRDDAPFTLPEFIDYRDQNESFETLAGIATWNPVLSGTGAAERLQGMRISASAFQMLGVTPAVGRILLPSDDDANSERVAVLGHSLWQRRFGGDTKVAGTRLTLNGDTYTVVGVLPRDYIFPVVGGEIAVPLMPDTDPLRNVRGSANFLRMTGRLKPGISRGEAEAHLTALSQQMRDRYPVEYARKRGVRLEALHDRIVGNFRVALLFLLSAVLSVLLIGCTNLASLLLARATARKREMAVRMAVGASRLRLVRQMLTESVLLGAAGGGAGLLLATWGIDALVALSPADLPRLGEVQLNSAVLLFAIGLSLFAGLLFGIAPALQGSQKSLPLGLTEGGRGGDAASGNRARRVLVAFESALAMLLLMATGLLVKSFLNLQQVDPGFDGSRVLMVRTSLPRVGYETPDHVMRLHDNLRERVAALPGVQAVAVVQVAPMSGVISRVPFTVEGKPPESPADKVLAEYRIISPDYFSALSVPVLQGRSFTESDTITTQPVALINEAFARQYFANESPLGVRLNIDDTDTGPRGVEIIGVVRNIQQLNLDAKPTLDIYLPLHQVHPDQITSLRNNQFWFVRTATNPLALADAFLRELRAVDPNVAATGALTMDQHVLGSLIPRRFLLNLLGPFAGSALLLTVMGIYAVISYAVAQRRRELGVRLALGARPQEILRLVIGQGMLPVVTGIALGMAASVFLARWVSSLLFGTSAADPATLAAAAITLSGTGLLACYVPARRAAQTDPVVALRYE